MDGPLPKLQCGGCRKCCLGDTITLDPSKGDDPRAYRTKRLEDGRLALRKARDGNCVYLGKSGCQIYGRQPYMCRVYDCRTHFLNVERMGPHAVRARLQDPAKTGFREGQRRVTLLRMREAA
jgi:hypothetical protein